MAASVEPAPVDPAPLVQPGARTVHIRPTRGLGSIGLDEIWRYRELLFFLTWRDVKVRYKQTALGASWAVLQPLALMGVFSLFVGHLLKTPSDGVPYPVFAFAALLPWAFFSQSLTMASSSLISNANLVSKVYFPKIMLPVAAMGSYLLDLVIGLGIYAVFMVAYGITPTLATLLLPLFVLLALLTVQAVGIWLAAISARYRDVVYAVPLVAQIWLFASPVAYSSSVVPHQYRWIYGLNPMVGVIDGFRWALLGSGQHPSATILVSTVVVIVVLVSGLAYFQRTQRTFADTI